MSVPILGNSNPVTPQARLNVSSMVGEAIEQTQQFGLKVGRLSMQMPLGQTDVASPLAVEAFDNAGCSIVAVNEMAVPGPQGAICIVSILFRTPPN